MFKVNNKDTRTTFIADFRYLPSRLKTFQPAFACSMSKFIIDKTE